MKVAVRDLSCLYKNGDLETNIESDLDPKEAHKLIQQKYKSTEKSEYYITHNLNYNNYDFEISGYIDGVLENNTLEEIKSTTKNLNDIVIDKEHLAQLKIYGYLYSYNFKLDSINLKLTYINLNSYKVKSFIFKFNYDVLKEFFYHSLDKYIKIIERQNSQEKLKELSIKKMTFPYPTYRKGQLELMRKCYTTIKNKEILYAIAPTGIGKTLATIFSSLKAISEPKSKIFYLTAKTIGKQVALDSVKKLFNNSLELKAIELTAKDKVCFQDERNCDPNVCPYAKKYYEKLPKAIDSIYPINLWDTNEILNHAKAFNLCPFEFSLDLSYYADIVIGDYNYIFDPFVHLMRYSDNNNYNSILLIDEAHNLINRSRDMYSVTINLIKLKRLGTIFKDKIKYINTNITFIINFIKEKNIEKPMIYTSVPKEIISRTKQIVNKLEDYFNENKEFKDRKEALDIYFELVRFNKIFNYFDNNFRFIIDNFDLSIKCLDASKFLLEKIDECYGTTMFSATLEPSDYYKFLLTRGSGNVIKIDSPFDSNNLKIFVKSDVSTKYNDREYSIDSIIDTINTITTYKTGNYIVFFPSYKYMNMVLEKLDNVDYEIIVQTEAMSENERIEYLNKFNDSSKTKVFFCITGGSFGEGIDFVGDMLIGVVIIGVGLPAIDYYNDTLRDYYNDLNKNGFDYVYTIPGFNKVVQSVGRIIRTESDRGVAILVDSRFNTYKYRSLMPSNWNIRYENNLNRIKNEIKTFKDNEKNR